MRAKFHLILLPLTFVSLVHAQSPIPIVTPVPAKPVQAPATVPPVVDASADNLKILRDLKAANDEIIKKQKATLEMLDELQKSADQIKIYTKRS